MLEGRSSKVSTAMVLLFLLMCLSVVAGVEGLSHKEHEAISFWHCVRSFGCFSLCPHVAALRELGQIF